MNTRSLIFDPLSQQGPPPKLAEIYDKLMASNGFESGQGDKRLRICAMQPWPERLLRTSFAHLYVQRREVDRIEAARDRPHGLPCFVMRSEGTLLISRARTKTHDIENRVAPALLLDVGALAGSQQTVLNWRAMTA
jgi:hypothetical protein